jgi:hypothetical protein
MTFSTASDGFGAPIAAARFLVVDQNAFQDNLSMGDYTSRSIPNFQAIGLARKRLVLRLRSA